MSSAHVKLSKILGTKEEVIIELDARMSYITGKTNVPEKIIEENSALISGIFDKLGKKKPDDFAGAKEVLSNYLRNFDSALYNYLDKPDFSKLSENCGKLCETARELNNPRQGFFLKKEKALEMLEKFPPNNLLKHFGYKTVGELTAGKDFSSIFSSLRFAQDNEWMHKFFDEAYDDLTPDDFEERDVEIKVLGEEWLEVASKFMEKKFHNLSHLKELGIIFIIPLKIDTPGEMTSILTLLLHYLNEVPFYSKLFKKYSSEPDFTVKLKSLLRGDVPTEMVDNGNLEKSEMKLMIVQRYLAKDDENEPRLLVPHINPEAEHWYKALGDMAKLDFAGVPQVNWRELDFAGDFFGDGGVDKFLSFNLLDLTLSLARQNKIDYIYHQREALWNKIFIEYVGRDKMNELVDENLINGFIKLNK